MWSSYMTNCGSSSTKPIRRLRGVLLVVASVLLAACQSAAGAPTPDDGPTTITLYNWVDYMPQSVIDAFTAEYGIQVEPVVYEAQEEVVAGLRAGNSYDLVVLTVEYIPDLLENGFLAEIDHRNVPNVKNIPANFRDITFDPGNRYTIPYHWGTTGLLVRRDLVAFMPTRWSDLWDTRFGGKVAIWPLEDALLPIALKVLGYSANSEEPAEIEAAFAELRRLRDHAYIIGNENATVIPDLAAGKAVLAYGWAYDALLAAEDGLPIEYVLPEEGAVLWSDYLLIPSSSPHKAEAELFLNFLLRPDIAAQLVAESYYPVANDAALPLIDPELLTNPIIYPPAEDLVNAELTLPLSSEGKRLRSEAWAKFMAEVTAVP
jgi:spermidine/putrescine transport system substrate-binding protein